MSQAHESERTRGAGPERAGVVLVSLIMVAAVANLNLSVANVALPDIGKAFDSSQVTLNLIAVGYSLGLAASVLYLGALGDRYGRKMMLVLGTALAIPMSLLAAFAPSDEVLFVARVGGGLAAGMAYPTTLALITALWFGPGRTKSIALWSALGGAIAALGPLVAGALLTQFEWGSVFLITLPLAVVALVMAFLFVPSHVNETTDPVDNLGGILSVVLVGALILAINFAPVPNETALVVGLALIAVAALGAFFIRQRRAANPLYDLNIAGRRIFWVAAVRGDHRLRVADGRDVREPAVPPERQRLLDAPGRCGDPPGGARDGASSRRDPRSSSRLAAPGSRCSAATSSSSRRSCGCCSSGPRARRTGRSRLAYIFIGAGVGLAGTPASHSLTGSVPSRARGWHPAPPISSATSAARSCSRSSGRC